MMVVAEAVSWRTISRDAALSKQRRRKRQDTALLALREGKRQEEESEGG